MEVAFTGGEALLRRCLSRLIHRAQRAAKLISSDESRDD